MLCCRPRDGHLPYVICKASHAAQPDARMGINTPRAALCGSPRCACYACHVYSAPLMHGRSCRGGLDG